MEATNQMVKTIHRFPEGKQTEFVMCQETFLIRKINWKRFNVDCLKMFLRETIMELD